MMLPPQANLFVFRDPDPEVRDAVTTSLKERSRFDRVRSLPGDWIVAQKFLPGTIDTDRGNLAFAEGGDLFPDDGELRRLTRSSPAQLHTLPGDFSYVLNEKDSCYVVRSCGGLAPMYIFRNGDRVAVATRLTDMATHVPDTLEIDPLPHAMWAAGMIHFPDNRTFLKDVSIVPRGEVRIIGTSSLKRVEYWNPRPARLRWPNRAAVAEHRVEFREVLVTHLERELDSEGPNLLTLSGGVDSSCLAALATRVIRRGVDTLSFVPPGGDELTLTTAYLDNLRRELPLGRETRLPFDTATHIDYVRTRPHVVFPAAHPALCVLPRITRDSHPRVLFGGEFGDETTGSVFTFPDWVQHMSLFRILRPPSRLPRGPKDIARWARMRMQSARSNPPYPFFENLGPLFREEVRMEYREWLGRRVTDLIDDRLPWRHLNQRTHNDAFVAMNWETATSMGIRRSFPYFNRAILELTFRLHPSELIGPGFRKLPRSALVQEVPRANLFRDDRGHWTSERLEHPKSPPSDPRMTTVIADYLPSDDRFHPFIWSLARFLEDLDRAQQVAG